MLTKTLFFFFYTYIWALSYMHYAIHLHLTVGRGQNGWEGAQAAGEERRP